MLDCADRSGNVATALAAHGEDKDDRFLPKMIWFGLAPRRRAMIRRARLALADKTPLPSLADSIRWFAARQPQGRDLLVTAARSRNPRKPPRATCASSPSALKDEATVADARGVAAVAGTICRLRTWPALPINSPRSSATSQCSRKCAASSPTKPSRCRSASSPSICSSAVGDAEATPIFARCSISTPSAPPSFRCSRAPPIPPPRRR